MHGGGMAVEAVHERFRERVFLYREANVLLAVLMRVHQDPLFEQPLREYERILFPESPETPAGAARLQAVKKAMQDLRMLMNPEDRRKLTWGRNWFATIGHDETNPATFMLFYILWCNLHVAAHESLERMVV
jgi:hypothetical protein